MVKLKKKEIKRTIAIVNPTKPAEITDSSNQPLLPTISAKTDLKLAKQMRTAKIRKSPPDRNQKVESPDRAERRVPKCYRIGFMLP